MAKLSSAGLLVYRAAPGGAVEVLLAHMGGPYWRRKDSRAWTIPKGEHGEGEDPFEVARREFEEEIGRPPPDGEPVPLGAVRQSGGKVVTAWAVPGDLDVTTVRSNTFTLEWPPGSGRFEAFPEVDRAGWFDDPTAREKLVAGQVPFLDRLAEALAEPGHGPPS